MNRKMLENERIRLRALEPEDLEWLYRWENDTSLWEVGNTLAPYSRYILKEYIADSYRSVYETGQLRLMIVLQDTGEAVGLMDLFDLDAHHSRAAFGILLDPSRQGQGLATEALELAVGYAFSFLKLHQVYVHVPVGNTASRKLFARCGFMESGVLKDWISIKDGYSDVWVMQRFRG